MRFGLVGTGFWAREVHGRGLSTTPGAELVAVWGRNPAAARDAAVELGAAPAADFASLVTSVDAVAFAVPPDVQAHLAVQAATAGRHLLLEKPVATSIGAAHDLGAAVADAGVASAVFVTGAYSAARREWLASLRADGPWQGASGLWLGSAFATGSPFDTPWRRAKGALWDLGPHLVAAFEDALGPVEAVRAATTGAHGVVQMTLDHGGATSTATATLEAPAAAARTDVVVWGGGGASVMPPAGDVLDAYRSAVTELMGAASSGDPVAADLRYGIHLVEVLAAVEGRIDA